jgi:hypothetical protein
LSLPGAEARNVLKHFFVFQLKTPQPRSNDKNNVLGSCARFELATEEPAPGAEQLHTLQTKEKWKNLKVDYSSLHF